MKNKYRFSPHLKIAHSYWQTFLQRNDVVIDATCGNGQDTLFLASLLQLKKIYGFDIQAQAIENTQKLLKKNLNKDILKNIFLFNVSHIDFSKYIKEKANLIIYNLGYLPSGNKAITTMTDITIKSIQSAFSILNKKGAICITCYPGHLEGLKEKNAILNFLKTLDNKTYNICHHQWINKQSAPSVIWIYKY